MSDIRTARKAYCAFIDETEDAMRNAMDTVIGAALLAFDEDDEIAGLITLSETLSLYAGGKIGVINELYVIPEYRSEGLGKSLLDMAKELGETRNWKRLEVTTPGDDYQKTLRFYEREGFFKIGPRYKFELD